MSDFTDNTGRRHGRVPLQRRVRVLVNSGGDWIPVMALAGDLSLGGCSFRVLDPLDAGNAVIAAFPGIDAAHEHVVFGVVRHCTFDDREWMKVGVGFTRAPDGIDAEALLAELFPDAA
ncbi:MAG: PilZ domain-containing protein [Planctomycetota bacterium]